MENFLGGYYIKARQIQDSTINDKPPVFREVWDKLIQLAKFRETGNDDLARGQLCTTVSKIQESLSWKIGFRKESYSRRSIYRVFKFLESEKMIEIIPSREPSRERGRQSGRRKEKPQLIITIVNYSAFQDPLSYKIDPPHERPMNAHTNAHTKAQTSAQTQHSEIPINSKGQDKPKTRKPNESTSERHTNAQRAHTERSVTPVELRKAALSNNDKESKEYIYYLRNILCNGDDILFKELDTELVKATGSRLVQWTYAYWLLFYDNNKELKTVRTAKFFDWLNHLRRLHDIDEVPIDRIVEVYKYIKGEKRAFWLNTIRSTKGLRKNFDGIISSMKLEQVDKDKDKIVIKKLNYVN